MLGFGKQFPTTQRWLYFTKHFFRNSIVTQRCDDQENCKSDCKCKKNEEN